MFANTRTWTIPMILTMLLPTCGLGDSPAGPATAPSGPAVIPRPASLEVKDGLFKIGPSTRVLADKEARAEAQKLIDALGPAMGFKLELAAPDTAAAVAISAARVNTVALQVDPLAKDSLGPEGYTLTVTAQQIVLRAAAPAGLFYAGQTLRQLLPPQVFSPAKVEGVAWTVPCVAVTDRPRFAWRGLLIDPARNFIPVPDVLAFIDAMALHKFNRLQMHLTDDQGWRIEIKKYPRLTEVGAWREQTLIGHVGRPPHKFDGKRHGGFYSQDDVRRMVAYAADRHVTIMPEIEMPGHFRAAISAYPNLGVFPDKQKGLRPWTIWGISPDILAPRPEGVQFCKDVLDEVIALFPSLHIHLGGDEAIKDQWKASPEIQQMIREKGLKDEHELQAWFTRQIDEHLTRRGRRLVGWDEILQGGLAPGATVMSWRGTEGGITAARAGHDVIMAPHTDTYFDYYQGPASAEPLAIGGNLPLAKVYAYEPVPAALSAEQARHILGSQAQLWGEYIATAKHRQYMAFPRACAFAEVVWSAKDGRDFAQFRQRLERHLKRLEAAGISFRPLKE